MKEVLFKELCDLRARKEQLQELLILRAEVKKLEAQAFPGSDSLKIISEEVCSSSGITLGLLLSKKKPNQVARARQIVFFLARQLTNEKLETIGHAFGKHHATVLYGVRRISDISSVEPTFKRKVQAIELRCVSRMA